jgi:sugar lactone lactonase YvrE
VLLNNQGDALSVKADGDFRFATALAQGAAYAVSIQTQPLWQACTVSGGSGSANTAVSNVQVQCTRSALVSTLAGSGAQGKDNHGNGALASFNFPYGVAVDGSANVYVADTYNHLIRRITPQGDVTTLAGSGNAAFTDGKGASASFNVPRGVAADGGGNVYVADTFNHRIRRITPQRDVTTLAGSGNNAFTDGQGASASFDSPRGVAADGGGNVYVADTFNRRIRRITPQGDVTTLAGSGNAAFADGKGASASFNVPRGVAVDGGGNVYVADTYNHRIRRITPQGDVTTLAGSGNQGFADGKGASASFNVPEGMAVDGGGNIYVGDTNNHRIRKIISPATPKP